MRFLVPLLLTLVLAGCAQPSLVPRQEAGDYAAPPGQDPLPRSDGCRNIAGANVTVAVEGAPSVLRAAQLVAHASFQMQTVCGGPLAWVDLPVHGAGGAAGRVDRQDYREVRLGFDDGSVARLALLLPVTEPGTLRILLHGRGGAEVHVGPRADAGPEVTQGAPPTAEAWWNGAPLAVRGQEWHTTATALEDLDIAEHQLPLRNETRVFPFPVNSTHHHRVELQVGLVGARGFEEGPQRAAQAASHLFVTLWSPGGERRWDAHVTGPWAKAERSFEGLEAGRWTLEVRTLAGGEAAAWQVWGRVDY